MYSDRRNDEGFVWLFNDVRKIQLENTPGYPDLSRENAIALLKLQDPANWPELATSIEAVLAELAMKDPTPRFFRSVIALGTRYSLNDPDGWIKPFSEVGKSIPNFKFDGENFIVGVSPSVARGLVTTGLRGLSAYNQTKPIVGFQAQPFSQAR